jgi:hypothetical protein
MIHTRQLAVHLRNISQTRQQQEHNSLDETYVALQAEVQLMQQCYATKAGF